MSGNLPVLMRHCWYEVGPQRVSVPLLPILTFIIPMQSPVHPMMTDLTCD